MGDLDTKFYYRQPDSDRVETCTNIENRTDWDPQKVITEDRKPVTFTCDGSDYALRYEDPNNPCPDTAANGTRICYFHLQEKTGTSYTDVSINQHSSSRWLSEQTFYIGPGLSGRKEYHVFASPDQMETWVETVRATEPGAKRDALPRTVITNVGDLIRLSIGPDFLLGNEETIPTVPPANPNIFGTQYTAESNAFGGAGFTFRLAPGIISREPLPKSFDTGRDKLALAGFILNWTQWQLYFSYMGATGNDHISADPGNPATYRRMDFGLDWVLPRIAMSGIRQAAGLPSLPWDVVFEARAKFLTGTRLAGRNWAPKGSSLPQDFDLSTDMNIPFTIWELALLVNYTDENGSWGFEVHGRPPVTYTADGFTWSESSIGAVVSYSPPLNQHETIVDKWVDPNVTVDQPQQANNVPEPITPPPPVVVVPPPPPVFVELPSKPMLALDASSLFKTAKADLSPAGQKAAKAIAEQVAEYYQGLMRTGYPPGTPVYLTIEGDTDSRGSDANNLSLSQRRAGTLMAAVQKALANNKRRPRQLGTVVIGYGETRILDQQGNIIARTSCTEGTANSKADIRPHQCPSGTIVENMKASRRATVRLTTDPAAFAQDQAIAAQINPPTVQSMPDAALANTAITLLQKKKNIFENVYYDEPNNTIVMVVAANYGSSEETTNRSVQQKVQQVRRAVLSAKKPLAQASRNLAVALVVHTANPGATPTIVQDRATAIDDKLHIFREWPSKGLTPTYEVAQSVTDVQEAIREQLSSVQRVPQADAQQLGAVKATVKRKNIQGIPTATYRIDGTALAFDKSNNLKGSTVALLQTLVREAGAGKYVTVFFTAADDATMREKVVVRAGLAIKDTNATAADGVQVMHSARKTGRSLFVMISDRPLAKDRAEDPGQ